MKDILAIFVPVLIFSLVELGYSDEVAEPDKHEFYRFLERELKELRDERSEERRDFRDCKDMGESCRGLPRCCGDAQCFWESGYSALKTGVCVQCIDRGQKCQRDNQCCEELICDKNAPWNVDGMCQPAKSLGSECYRDNQCASGNCDKSKWYNLRGECVD